MVITKVFDKIWTINFLPTTTYDYVVVVLTYKELGVTQNPFKI